jgi:type IV secretory pathway VirD2 relaxase
LFLFYKKKTATPNKISKNARNHEMRAKFIKPHNLGKTGLKKSRHKTKLYVNKAYLISHRKKTSTGFKGASAGCRSFYFLPNHFDG